MNLSSQKTIAWASTASVIFCVAYLMIGYLLKIEHTLYGVFANLLGGLFLLLAPAALILSFLLFRAEKYKLPSTGFLLMALNVLLLSLLFIDPLSLAS
ncbi:MAG: hypothetical protein R8P61_19830 [Bacteroidia bacterium]|nr:hypothetical protein [Bacteroidia bacterium]